MPDDIKDLLRISEQLGITGSVIGIEDEQSINIPIDERLDIDQIVVDGDTKPVFVIVETVRSDTASRNGRLFTERSVMDIHNQTPGTMGYLGHPDPSRVGFEFRDPQSIFVGSILETEGGILRAISKAYIFPESPLRQWVPASIAAGNPIGVSVFGDGQGRPDPISGNVIIERMHNLESIDWTNPGTQGMLNSESLNVVNEMDQNGQNNQGGSKDMEVGVKLDTITIAELKQANPTIVDNIIANISIAELQQHNPKVVEKIQDEVKVSEISLTLNGEEKKVSLKDVQSHIDARDIVIKEMTNDKIATEMAGLVETKITELVEEDYRDAVKNRVTKNNYADEASLVAAINEEVTFIAELAGNMGPDFKKPKGNPQRKNTGDDASAIANGILAGLGVKTGKEA